MKYLYQPHISLNIFQEMAVIQIMFSDHIIIILGTTNKKISKWSFKNPQIQQLCLYGNWKIMCLNLKGWSHERVFLFLNKNIEVEDHKGGKRCNKIHVRINRSLCYLALWPIRRSRFLFSVLHVKKVRTYNLQRVTQVTSCGKRAHINFLSYWNREIYI